MTATKIEWAETVWNPVTGCTRVSAGCDNCYAAAMSRRLAGMGQEKYVGLVNPGKGHFNGTVRCHDGVLSLPLRWKKPKVVFVNSMSDLFHESVPFQFIDKVFRRMSFAQQHTYIVLTKRPKRMAEYLSRLRNPLPNVWLGTSVENQEAADERIPWLLRCPAAVRLLSVEPLLGAITLRLKLDKAIDHTPLDHCEIDWVIVGGESGPKARPMHPEWARSIRDQCQAAGVPFFFKQWGAFNPASSYYVDDDVLRERNLDARHVLVVADGYQWDVDRDGQPPPDTWIMHKLGCSIRGLPLRKSRILDGRTWNERPKLGSLERLQDEALIPETATKT